MLIEQETSSLCFDLRETYIIAQNCAIVPNHCDVEKNRTKHHWYTTPLLFYKNMLGHKQIINMTFTGSKSY